MNFTDQIGNTIRLDSTPIRIISLVPSQTELLADLELEDHVVGITKFCIHPESWFRSKTRVGGTKQVNLQKVAGLQPDLIIANKEENEKEQIKALMKIAPVWTSDIYTLNDALEMIRIVGEMTGKSKKAESLAGQIQSQFAELDKIVERSQAGKKVLYFIWNNPAMVAGRNTFIDEMLTRIGFENCIKDERYPLLEDCEYEGPDIIMLSSEPFPFGTRHVAEFQKRFPDADIKIVDGEMFSWYGSRLILAPAYFRTIT